MFLAIDYGKKRIGLAVGAVLPKGIGTIDGRLPLDVVVSQIGQKCAEYEVEAIVVGMPVRTGGERGTLAAEIEGFAESLKQSLGLPVHFEPEQYSSAEATRQIEEAGGRDIRDGKVDELAAVLLLEQFLTHRGLGKLG